MAINTADISFVMQGSLDVGWDLRYVARDLKRIFPGCQVILSTQRSAAKSFEPSADFDHVILGDDPGALPSVKLVGGPHNINRQKASALAGMSAVSTTYAVKLRTDCYLSSDAMLGFLEAWGDRQLGSTSVGQSRILAVSLFTVNPIYDERVPYHVSDWFQFGRTQDLVSYWTCPDYDFQNATWYETRPYAANSLPREMEFRSRFATEQWLTLNYLFEPQNFPLQFHNDIRADTVDEFEKRLVDNFIIVHPSDIGLKMPKYEGFFRNRYFSAICYSFEDWKGLALAHRNLSGPLSGYDIWPFSPKQTRFYIALRRRFRWLRRLPINRVRGWFG